MVILKHIFTNKTIRYAYLAWFSIALFYCYQYILRVSPGVLVEEIRDTFHITAEQFSTLGFYYLIAYAILQIPLGIFVDRLGVKITCIVSILVCAFGAGLLGSTNTFAVAQLSRFIIGAGSAAAFMCTLKFISDHLPPGKRGFLMGSTLALGTVGALLSARLVAYFDEFFGWRDVMTLSVVIGIVVACLIAIFVKGDSQDKHVELYKQPLSHNFAEISKILKSRVIVLYAIIAIGLYTPLSAVADLWGTAFLMEKFKLSSTDSAHYVMLIYIGLTIGSMTLPWMSEKYNKLNTTIIVCSFCLLLCFSLLLYMPFDSLSLLVVLLLGIGFFGGAEMMCFTGALAESHKYDSGQIIGIVNTLNMLGGAFLQLCIGLIMDKNWSGLIKGDSLRHYSILEFELAFSTLTIMILMCSLASLLLLHMKHKHSKLELKID
ncbi:MAG: MFS transporter [Alphaproteobacteria bacterium]|jgi:sugar phosphate permease|nr:MFS transporter [Candidatus Jidaibacter sp.]